MIIGFLVLEIYLPYCHSLKEKRKRLNSLRALLTNKRNVAFAEMDFQNKWQRSKIGIVTLNNEKKVIEKLLDTIASDAEKLIDGNITSSKIEFF